MSCWNNEKTRIVESISWVSKICQTKNPIQKWFYVPASTQFIAQMIKIQAVNLIKNLQSAMRTKTMFQTMLISTYIASTIRTKQLGAPQMSIRKDQDPFILSVWNLYKLHIKVNHATGAPLGEYTRSFAWPSLHPECNVWSLHTCSGSSDVCYKWIIFLLTEQLASFLELCNGVVRIRSIQSARAKRTSSKLWKNPNLSTLHSEGNLTWPRIQ